MHFKAKHRLLFFIALAPRFILGDVRSHVNTTWTALLFTSVAYTGYRTLLCTGEKSRNSHPSIPELVYATPQSILSRTTWFCFESGSYITLASLELAR